MFNDKYGLTAAVLAGTKTQTRRIMTGVLQAIQELRVVNNVCEYKDPYTKKWYKCNSVHQPKYKVGEIVAVAQSYFDIKTSANSYRPPIWEGYKEWHEYLNTLPDWDCAAQHNKMFVKAELMPHRIRIEKVRVERLQDISNEDCLAEGITTKIEGKFEVGNGYGWDTTIERLKRDTFFTPRAAYAALIDHISGKGTWESNPWVYAFSFKLSED